MASSILPIVAPGKASKYSNTAQSAPLLSFKDQEDGQQHDGYKSASFSSAVFSLSTSIVGAGIMGLPATMKTIGLIPGLLLTIFVGFLTNASIEFMLRYSTASKSTSYAGVMADSFGRIGSIILQICVVINNFGLLVVYLIIIADVLAGSTTSSVHHTGVLEEWAGGETWWNSRTIVMLFTTVFVLVPLVSFRHVDSLKISSAISVGLAVLFVIVTAAITVYKLAAGSISMPNLFPQIGSDASSILSLFSVVPVVVTAFICHHTVHPILNELESSAHPQTVIQASLAFCTAIYVATSVFGYLLFGDDTLSDVLSNFDVDLGIPYSTVFSDTVRVGYALHLMLVFPVLHFSLRLNLDGLMFPRAGPLSLDTRRFFFLTACLIVTSFLGASFVPDIWDAFQVTGSTSAVCLGFVFPGALVLRDVHRIASKRERWMAGFMVMLAAGASCIALSGDIYDLFD